MNESSPSPESTIPAACRQCGVSLPAKQTGGLCPRCLMEEALSPTNAPTHSSDAPSAEEVSAQFPGLDILECLGRGGMGIVYKARQPQLDRFVAVKLLPRANASDFSFGERFQREARALARLNHPNIISVYDFGETDGFFYFLMEYVDGANLRQLQHGERLSLEQALAIVPKLCEALQYAHDEGVVHRDIKPENILIDTRGRVKIADFGLARLLDPAASGHTLTKSQQVMGTPHYMAPEQMEGTHAVDHRADIYSLGVVFYEMLTGSLPLGRFEAPSHRVKVDVRLDEIVLRSLERKPELRYQQAREVKTAVENVTSVAAAPRSESPEMPFSETLPRFSGTGIIGVVFAFLSLLLLAASIYAYYKGPHPNAVFPSLGAFIVSAVLASAFGMAEMNRIREAGAHPKGLGLAFANTAILPVHALNFALFGLAFLCLSWFEKATIFTERILVTRALFLSGGIALVLDPWLLRHWWLALTGRSSRTHRAGRSRLLHAATFIVIVGVACLFLLRNPLLLRTSKYREPKLAKTLLMLGADPNAEDLQGHTALFHAIVRDDLQTADLLIRQGADLSKGAPLAWAAALGYEAAVGALMAAGADIELPLDHGITPLMLASALGYTDTVRRLLEAGANIDARDSGITADAYYLTTTFGRAVQDRRMGDLDFRWPGKQLTSLMLAAEGGHLEIVRLLLDAGADPSLADSEGRFAKDRIGASHHDEIERLLLAIDSKPIKVVEATSDALLQAAANGQTGRVRELLRKGKDVNDKDPDGLTALSAAAMNGHVSTFLTLILLGANLDETDNQGRTPLILAAEHGQAAVIKALYDFETTLAGVRSELTAAGRTPDAVTLLKQHIAGVDVRIFDEIGARVPEIEVNMSAQDKSGQTAFMKAALNGHSDCGLALNAWQDEQLQDREGHTAAMLAAMNGRANFIREMMKAPNQNFGTRDGNFTVHSMLHPQNLALRDADGRNAIALAESSGYPEIAELMRGEMRRAIDGYSEAIATAEGLWTSNYYRYLGWARRALGDETGAHEALEEAARRSVVELKNAGRYEPEAEAEVP
jgi:ankyrin repeat protein/predicted Ser/Thr protein kinase